MEEDNIEFVQTKLYFDGVEIATIEAANLEVTDIHAENLEASGPLINLDRDWEGTFTVGKFPFWSKVRLFGFWYAIKTLFKR